jgi:plastocyanin
MRTQYPIQLQVVQDQDPESGSQFDTSIIDAGATAQIETANLAAGDYKFYCSVHPYMLGNLKVS